MHRRALLGLIASSPALAGLPPPRLRRRLFWFQDQKLGLMLHWGPYSLLGCIESWPLSWADRAWANPSVKTREEMTAFRARYFALPDRFDPPAFEPDAWADVAHAAGMRYVVFTTKHHDGFCMFDTRQTDYRVTHPRVPFSRHPRANVTWHVFEAFRRRGLGIGAYFSKPDWHSPDYWDPARWAEDRNPNYAPRAEPARWARFVRFTHAQIRELVTGYGRIDVLWLDGAQVKPPEQDLDMDRLVAAARARQPDLLVVNRGSGGLHEDYATPEQEVPRAPRLDTPWESCITVGTSWSFKPDDEYKPASRLIATLVEVVAKGGNVVFNVGVQPDGRLPAGAVARLQGLGAWMAVNAEAIHGTRPVAPFFTEDAAFTTKGGALYAFLRNTIGGRVHLPRLRLRRDARAVLLGTGAAVPLRADGDGFSLEVPRNLPVAHLPVVKLA
jgi:alpha-L-fucosidase